MHLPPHWQPDYPLARLSTWRIGGPARYYAAPASEAQLRADLRLAAQEQLPVLAVGGGSNLLFSDRGYDGLILQLPGCRPSDLGARSDETSHLDALVGETSDLDPTGGRMPCRGAGIVQLAAADSLATTVRRLAERGWAGLHWAESIPGTVGGAIINNAGAYGGQIADRLESVRVMRPDGTEETWPAERLALTYRSSALKGHEPTQAFLLSGAFRLERASSQELIEAIEEIRRRRHRKLPSLPSCGCVFRNPEGQVAGRLIEEAGLCGLRAGDAEVSGQHANFIVNRGHARAEDVLQLIREVRERVRQAFGLELALEVQLVGFQPVPLPVSWI